MAHTAGMDFCECSVGLLSPNVWTSFSLDQKFDVIRVDSIVEAFFDGFAHIDAVVLDDFPWFCLGVDGDA